MTQTLISGVVLVIHCSTTNRFLLLEELEDKPLIAKTAGQVSFPCETRKDLEIGWEKTTVRALREELGIQIQPTDVPKTACLNPEKPIRFKYPTGVQVDLAIVRLSYAEEFSALPEDTDVRHYGWFSGKEIRVMSQQPEHLRCEMQIVMDACGIDGVIKADLAL